MIQTSAEADLRSKSRRKILRFWALLVRKSDGGGINKYFKFCTRTAIITASTVSTRLIR